MVNLANSYDARRPRPRVLMLREETLRTQESQAGSRPPRTPASMGNLARSLVKLGRGLEALPIIRATAETWEQLHRTDAHSRDLASP